MYIIVSSDTLIHCEISALGHEIHMSRYVLCQLLHHKRINKNDTIVTRTEDRMILYTKLFKNVIIHSTFRSLNVSADDILDLTEFMQTDVINRPVSESTLTFFSNKLSFDFKNLLYGNDAADVQYLLSAIDYPPITDLSMIEKKFIVIHMRVVYSPEHEWVGKQTVQHIINTLQDADYTIICYTSDPDIRLDSPKKEIIYVNNFPLYCALMNNEMCEMVISEISGGGEMSQYCHNKAILLYPSRYNLGEPYFQRKLNEIRSRLHVKWQPNEGSTNAVLHKFPSIYGVIEYINLH
jgi:hypothetical protein